MKTPVFTSLTFTAVLLTSLQLPGASLAQNSYSFTDAAQSQVDYTRTRSRAAADCGTFRHRTTSDYTIISAELIPASAEAPEHCRLHGVIEPEVQFWVTLPTEWNRRFYMHGNGGYAGRPFDHPYRYAWASAPALRHGFATAYTNTGHDHRYEPQGSFAHDEIQKTLDYSYRAVHLTANTAKELTDIYYDRAPDFSYFDGCSTGGRQGLMEAQRFPDDFDGIAAGAPVNDQTNLHIWMAWIYQMLDKTPITPEKVETVLAPRVLEACDGLDGAEDGLIQNPEQCSFTPSKDLPVCEKGGEDCFSPAEIATLERIYSPVMSKGKEYFPGLQLGVEPAGTLNVKQGGPEATGWQVYIIDKEGGLGRMEVFADTFFKYFAFVEDDPDYDWRNLDFDEDVDKMGLVRSMLDAVKTDMSAFKARGGKLLSYHGWADGGPPASFTVKYYNDVIADMGEAETREFYRLFMVPGMFHCLNGFGTDDFDPMTALINWVERGIVPETIHAEQVRDGRVVRSRPLCPYPQISRYNGTGDMNDAENFTCTAP